MHWSSQSRQCSSEAQRETVGGLAGTQAGQWKLGARGRRVKQSWVEEAGAQCCPGQARGLGWSCPPPRLGSKWPAREPSLFSSQRGWLHKPCSSSRTGHISEGSQTSPLLAQSHGSHPGLSLDAQVQEEREQGDGSDGVPQVKMSVSES